MSLERVDRPRLENLRYGSCGFLDSVTWDDDRVVIEGWAFWADRERHGIPERILVIDDQTVLRSELQWTDRPDVRDAIPGAPLRCGFRVAVSPLLSIAASSAMGMKMISVLAEFSDGSLVHLEPESAEFKRKHYIELTSACNLRCVMCNQAIPGLVKPRHLSLQDLSKFEHLFRDARYLSFYGRGEPLLFPHLEACLEMIPRLKQVDFITNGQMLTGEISRVLLEHSPPVRHINISIDTTDEGRYEKIRGASLADLTANIAEFKEARARRGQHLPILSLNATLMRENMQDLVGLVRFAASVDGILQLRPLKESPHDPDRSVERGAWVFQYEEQKLGGSDSEVDAIFAEACSVAADLGVRMRGPEFTTASLPIGDDDRLYVHAPDLRDE